jgi:hypothetical protein
MLLPAGTRLGAYEVLERLGAGGMGEVYRARDSRLRRDVAIKVLREAPSPASIARLEQEARLAGSLNHPNIVTVFDLGIHDGAPFVVLELLEGDTLRAHIHGMGIRGALDVALQIARGLAAAHAKGILHRDLKPENVLLVHRGPAKILDFGLGRSQEPGGSDADTQRAVRTEAGTVLGTAGYMSPEQVRGATLDTRSDIFSFGIMLFEMISGHHPFLRETIVETLAAIVRDEPEGLGRLTPDASPGLIRIVHRCLQKDATDRFQSAADLAFALEGLSDAVAPAADAVANVPRRGITLGLALTAGAAIAAGAGLWFIGGPWGTEPPRFEQVSFRRGTVNAARFGPDPATILYSAAFEGGPAELYTARAGSPESRSLGLAAGLLLGISRSSELAVALGSMQLSGASRRPGTLARVPLAGGAPRETETSVLWADWIGTGGEMALVRQLADGRQQLEFPAGRPAGAIDGAIAYLRVAPRGDRVAYFEYPGHGNVGSLVVVDREGFRRTLTEGLVWPMGLAWEQDDSRLWFASGEGNGTTAIHALTLGGSDRIVYRLPGYATLQDRSDDGRLLLTRDDWRVEAMAQRVGAAPRDISWLDVSNVADMTSDGSQVAIYDVGVAAGSKVVSYLRATDGSPAVRLAEGLVLSLSPDGKMAIVRFATKAGSMFRIVPTGPGDSVPLQAGLPPEVSGVSWHAGGNRVVVTAREAGGPWRCYLADVPSGHSRPVTPAGTTCPKGTASPDGRLLLATTADGGTLVYPIDGSAPRPLPGIQPGERPVRWSGDGTAIFVRRLEGVPATVTRIRLSDGQRQDLATLGPQDPVGVARIASISAAADASAYAYSYLRYTSTLFLATGLR